MRNFSQPILTYKFYPNIKIWKAEIRWWVESNNCYKSACALGTTRGQAEKRLYRFARLDNSIPYDIVNGLKQLLKVSCNENLPTTLDRNKEAVSNSGWPVLQREIYQKDKDAISKGKEQG